MRDKQIAGILVASVTFGVMTTTAITPAGATTPDSPREDVFGRSTTSPRTAPHAPIRGQVSSTTMQIGPSDPAPSAPHPTVSVNSAPQQWFTAYDTFVATYKPSSMDSLKMSKSFNNEAERVTAFCMTVAKVSRNYKILAQKLESLPIPASMPETRGYRDSMAEWYKDSAQVYDDMIRPRPAARTKEELNAMIDDIKVRSSTLKSNFEQLAKMDSTIRLQHAVQPPQADDAIYAYAGHH